MVSAEDRQYICELSKVSVIKAKNELGESPDDRLAAVQAFRDWIHQQPHLTCPKTDTKMLLRFLRAAKFSQIRARDILQGYLNLRKKAPDLFLDIDSHDPGIRKILDTGFLSLLPQRTPEGVQILFLRPGKLAKMKFNLIDALRTTTLFMDYMSLSEETQVNGIALFIDMSDTNMGLISKFFTGDGQRWIKMWSKNIPGRIKGFHHYRAGMLMEALTALSKAAMPKKWTDRYTFHDTMESVYKIVPKQCLPDEYLPDDYIGKGNGTAEEISKSSIAALTEIEIRNGILYKTSNAYIIDESKRPTEEVTQHFRKLNVD